MFKLAICDDDISSITSMITLLEEYLESRSFSFEYSTFQNGLELTNALESGTYYNIYCLDILMPGFDGIQLGKEIRQKDQTAEIIYFTSSPEFALDSYRVKATDYILKPITKDAIFTVLDTVFERLKQTENSSIIVKDNQGIQKIILSSLVYAEAMGRKVVYHLNSGRNVVCSSQFSTVCDTLLEYSYFIKPHRSYVVNMNYIDRIENTEILLQNNHPIPLAQGKGKDIKTQYLSYQMKRT